MESTAEDDRIYIAMGVAKTIATVGLVQLSVVCDLSNYDRLSRPSNLRLKSLGRCKKSSSQALSLRWKIK